MRHSAYVSKEDDFCDGLGGVAEVDPTTVPEGVEVEIVDLDELKAYGTDYIKKLSLGARSYVKANGFIDFQPLQTLPFASSQGSAIFICLKQLQPTFRGTCRNGAPGSEPKE